MLKVDDEMYYMLTFFLLKLLLFLSLLVKARSKTLHESSKRRGGRTSAKYTISKTQFQYIYLFFVFKRIFNKGNKKHFFRVPIES